MAVRVIRKIDPTVALDRERVEEHIFIVWGLYLLTKRFWSRSRRIALVRQPGNRDTRNSHICCVSYLAMTSAGPASLPREKLETVL